jgi:hypothetical protein
MPRGDQTGPNGQGPMTGRGLGYCAGYPNPGFMNNSFGRGIGRGRGFGRGLGLGFRGGRGPRYNPDFYGYPPYSTPTKEEELQMLKNQAEFFKKDLEEIQKRISELESNKK